MCVAQLKCTPIPIWFTGYLPEHQTVAIVNSRNDGRSKLDSEVSENGNGSSTSDPVKDATRQHPPPAGSNFRPTSVR
jgi:hypothetical protein